mgnify:CR=1 FL=1
MLLLLLALVYWQRERLGIGHYFDFGGGGGNKKENPSEPVELRYKGKKMRVTKHAKCRMGCRYINEKEIMDVLAQERINHNKTRDDGECPSYAYEGKSNGKNLRIVVADCADEPRLVTVIELDVKHDCYCE